MLWEMSLLPSPRSPSCRHRSQRCRSPGRHRDAQHPSTLPCKNRSDSFIFCSCFFLTLKKQNYSQAVSSWDESPQPRSQRREKKKEFSAHPFGAEAALLLLHLLLFLPVPEAVVPLGFSMGACLNKSRLLCELGAWEKPRPREKQTSPAPGLRINTGVLLVTEAELNQSC